MQVGSLLNSTNKEETSSTHRNKIDSLVATVGGHLFSYTEYTGGLGALADASMHVAWNKLSSMIIDVVYYPIQQRWAGLPQVA